MAMNLKEQAEELGIKVDGRWSDTRIQGEINKMNNSVAPKEKPAEPEISGNKFESVDWANSRVKAIWDGQSPTLGIAERTGRIKAALKSKGFRDFDSLTFPHPDCDKYI